MCYVSKTCHVFGWFEHAFEHAYAKFELEFDMATAQ